MIDNVKGDILWYNPWLYQKYKNVFLDKNNI